LKEPGRYQQKKAFGVDMRHFLGAETLRKKHAGKGMTRDSK
jgi:hypothetical protein